MTDKLAFVFPSDPMNPKKYDPEFKHQAGRFSQQGFSCHVEPEELRTADKTFEGKTVVWRGWMKTIPEYEQFVAIVQASGGKPLTRTHQYQATHHLPNWYPHLGDMTPKTIFIPETYPETQLVELLKLNQTKGLKWDKFFIKDWVKSLKTGNGSGIEDPEEVPELLANMRKYRGEIEGGLCVRQFEELSDEKRFFVIDGKVHGEQGPEFEFAETAAARINGSRFYSVDVARRADGALRVVEIGDGQVSDLVGWEINDFVDMWLK